MKTFFGSMYEISSCYDRGFLIDEIMLYLIMYELFHDPYFTYISLVFDQYEHDCPSTGYFVQQGCTQVADVACGHVRAWD